jgi:hypothetical protein
MTTKFIMLEVTDLYDLLERGSQARQMAHYAANHCDGGLVTIFDQQISVSFIDRVFEHLNRHEKTFWDPDCTLATKGASADFIASLDNAQREAFFPCVAILIGQGRLELCYPYSSDPASPLKDAGEIVSNKHWVSYSFLESIQRELDKIVVGCSGLRLNEAILFSGEFLQSLDQYEREMLMPCTLQMIRGGAIEFPLVELGNEEELT